MTKKFVYDRLPKIKFVRGCNGFDGDVRDLVSEHRVSRTGSVREKFLKIKANEEYALAA